MKPGRVLLTAPQIRARVRALGAQITRHYKKHLPPGEAPIFLGIMNGALFLLADILRATDLPHVEISCLRLASYKGTTSTAKLLGLHALDKTVRGRHILIIDDILDTGHTLTALTTHLKKLGAAEIKICVLLQKRGTQKVRVRADWTGFRIPNHFVIGYGLDCDGRYRNLKQVRILST